MANLRRDRGFSGANALQGGPAPPALCLRICQLRPIVLGWGARFTQHRGHLLWKHARVAPAGSVPQLLLQP